MIFDANYLANEIEKEAKVKFSDDKLKESMTGISFKPVTKIVKEVIGDLGKRLGYEVAASGYHGADEGEWLYDMIWYKAEKGNLFQQAMVLESELGSRGGIQHAEEVDGDFQKLVQARAEVRVWVTACPNPTITAKHIANCKLQAKLFRGAMQGDLYIFIVYDWTAKSSIIERFELDLI
jgi:hypothetical protein